MKFRFFSGRLSLAAALSCLLLPGVGLVSAHASGTPIIVGPGPVVFAELKGTFSDLSIKLTASRRNIRVKGNITLRNTGTRTAKRVTASVYLSPEATLAADAKPIDVLHLVDFENGDGKIKRDGKVTIPLNYKVPTLVASTLSGQYIIVVLSAVDSLLDKPIVYGPLPKVP